MKRTLTFLIASKLMTTNIVTGINKIVTSVFFIENDSRDISHHKMKIKKTIKIFIVYDITLIFPSYPCI